MRKIELSENKENFGLTFSESKYKEFKETGNQNLFEEVIDSLMMNKYSDDVELNNYIKELPNDKKRIALLSTLDGNNNQWDKLKQLIDNKKSITDNIKEIILMLREFVKIGEVEKKKYGEVMTPLELVKDMLATLPKDVWSNPNLKWLDPANGTGPFPIMVIYKLIEGLKDWEPDEEKRYKHIIENMIYTCELQDRNVFLWLCAVDLEDKYVTNTYWGSFLEEGFDKHMKEVWGLDKFDIIIGNPPYQELKEGNSKSKAIWQEFVLKPLTKYLNIGGYLVMVHPSGWRNVDGVFKQVQIEFRKREILYLNMNTFKQGSNTFGAKTDFDFYCIRNTFNTDINTKVVDVDNEVEYIKLRGKEFIPNCKLNEVYNLVAKDNEERVNILHSYSDYETRKPHISREKTDEFKYPCIYTVNKGGTPTFKHSSINNKGHFGISKVIWGNGATGVFIDKNGEYGLTQFAYAIVDKSENLDNIKKALQNEYFIIYIMAFRDSLGDTYKKKIISLFRKDFWKEFID